MPRKRRRGGQTMTSRKPKSISTANRMENANSETSNEDCSDNSSASATLHTERTSSSENKTITEGIHKKFGKFRCVIDQEAKKKDPLENPRVTIEDVMSDMEDTSQNVMEEDSTEFQTIRTLNEENVQIVSIEDSSLSSEQSSTVYVTVEQEDKNIDSLKGTSREQVFEIVQGNIFKNGKVEFDFSEMDVEKEGDNETNDNKRTEEKEEAEGNDEAESLKLADELAGLKVNQGNNVEVLSEDSQKSNEIVYDVDNLESEIMIECVSEEVVECRVHEETKEENIEDIDQDSCMDVEDDSSKNEPETFKSQRHEEDNKYSLSQEKEILDENEVSEDEGSLEEQVSPEEIEEHVDTISEEEQKEKEENEEIELIINKKEVADDTQEIVDKEEILDSEEKTEKKAAKPTKRKTIAPKKQRSPKKTEKKPVKVDKKEPKKKKTPEKKTIEKKIKESPDKVENTEVRRSNRIKSITKKKQKLTTITSIKTVPKSKKLPAESDCSENSNSGNTDSDKTSSDTNFTAPNSNNEVEQKPVKVKSRWRRSSELEMSTNKNEENNNSNSGKESGKTMTPEEEIKMRLKQFVHLKDNTYLTDRVCCKEAKKMICDCFLTQEEIERGEYGCGEDCLNRLLMIECGLLCPLGDRCTNKRFQKTKTSPCEVFKTEKKGLGIRATKVIPNGEFILEYVGEVIDPDEFENRATEYSKGKNPHFYFMALRSDAVIDATQKGNISRFINHSCEPNAETQKWTVNGELRIGFFSKKTIQIGEEITFDYHFQRYGKEAQKCYCEAASCRGWLGEEPNEDDEEEEEEEDEEIVEEEEEEEEEIEDQVEEKKELEQKIEKMVVEENEYIDISKEKEEKESRGEVVKQEIEESSAEDKKEPSNTELTTNKLKPKAEKKKIIRKEKISRPKPIKILQKTRKELFDDPDVNQEIQMLMTTGLKNQAHTLKLSRLMVRATETAQKSNLLRVLRRGEFPCRRLFLDYHGLRLIHGWMTDAQKHCKSDAKQESLRLEILQTLATLPIPNKTMLQDSKVLCTVEKWSVPLKTEDELDSDSNSPKLENEEKEEDDEEENDKKEVKETRNGKKIEQEKHEDEEEKVEEPDEEDKCELRKSVGMDFENILKHRVKVLTKIIENLTVADFATMFEDDLEEMEKLKEIKSEQPDYEEEIVALALKLLEEWSSLKEVFRIPKKERIERMKEHEREADRGYKAALEHELERKRSSRYRHLQRHIKAEVPERIRKPYSSVDYKNPMPSPKFNKHERRKLFAMQVEQEEEQKRRSLLFCKQEMAAVLANDMRFTTPPDVKFQYMWNPQTGQWQKVQILNQSPQTPVNITQTPPNPMNLQSPLMNQNPGSFNATAPRLPYPFSSYPSNPHPQLPPHLPPAPNYPNIRQPIQMPQFQNQFPPNMVQPNQLPNMPPPSRPPLPILQNPTIHMQMPGSINPLPLGSANPTPLGPVNPPLPSAPPLPPLPSEVPLPLPVTPVKEKEEDLTQVRFAGPIPPPVKLPPKWKCAKDKYGRPYYYHIKIRISQWEPPEFPPPEESEDESSDTTSSSESSSLSSDSSSEHSDSDEDEMDDTKLMQEIKKNLKNMETEAVSSRSMNEKGLEEDSEQNESQLEKKPSLEDRLKDEFNLMKGEKEPAVKRRRSGLVTEIHIISPRTEEDKILAKKNLKQYKDNKEKLKRQKEMLLKKMKQPARESPPELPKKRIKVTVKSPKLKKHKEKEKEKPKEVDSETAKRIKETFRSSMASVMVGILNPYRKSDCKEGHISNNEDFKHLARKLTHFVMLKELKHCKSIEDLTCTDSVKNKAKEFVRKYMAKFGEVYVRPKDEMDY